MGGVAARARARARRHHRRHQRRFAVAGVGKRAQKRSQAEGQQCDHPRRAITDFALKYMYDTTESFSGSDLSYFDSATWPFRLPAGGSDDAVLSLSMRRACPPEALVAETPLVSCPGRLYPCQFHGRERLGAAPRGLFVRGPFPVSELKWQQDPAGSLFFTHELARTHGTRCCAHAITIGQAPGPKSGPRSGALF
jgi:hypothetical protein